jgi:release factor glutamine methyltransferase
MFESVRMLLENATASLARTSPSAALDAQVLLALALGRSRGELRARPEHVPSADERARFADLVRRRGAGEPVAYLRGVREFWSMPLRVTADVLVPRPETELVVEVALARIPDEASWRVLDLGTGSGAIALAIARERPRCTVIATDVSAPALAVARENAQALGLHSVELRRGEWYAPVGAERFHLIASNPPYVAEGAPALRVGELSFEPGVALAAGADGLRALRAVIAGAPSHLEPGGLIVLEHGCDQREAVRDALEANGFELIQCYQDLAGLDRVSAARLARERT